MCGLKGCLSEWKYLLSKLVYHQKGTRGLCKFGIGPSSKSWKNINISTRRDKSADEPTSKTVSNLTTEICFYVEGLGAEQLGTSSIFRPLLNQSPRAKRNEDVAQLLFKQFTDQRETNVGHTMSYSMLLLLGWQENSAIMGPLYRSVCFGNARLSPCVRCNTKPSLRRVPKKKKLHDASGCPILWTWFSRKKTSSWV